MTSIALAVLLYAQPATPAARVAQLELWSAFWPNLHHTLYAAAQADLGRAVRRLGSPVTGALDGDFSPAERRAWRAALRAYRELAARDLRTGEGMAALHLALAAAGDCDDGPRGVPPAIAAALRRAAPAYRRHLWPAHDRQNRAWIAEVAGRLARITPDAPARIAALLETRWYDAPVRVDVTYHGRAYTTLAPVHATLASGDPQATGWAGAELTLHEVTHGLTATLEAALRRAAARAGVAPDALDHLAMFYIVGAVVQDAAARLGERYTPYLFAAGVIDRGWSRQRGVVERHLGAYVARGGSLEAALDAWLADPATRR